MTRQARGHWTIRGPWDRLGMLLVCVGLLVGLPGCPPCSGPNCPTDPCDLNAPPSVLNCSEKGETPSEKIACWVQSDLRYTPTIPIGSNYEPGTLIAYNSAGQLILKASKSDCFPLVTLEPPSSDSFSYSYTLAKESSLNLEAQLGDFFKQLIGSTPSVTLKTTNVATVDLNFQTLNRQQTTEFRLRSAFDALPPDSLCREYLQKPDTFVVVESAALGSFKLVFRDAQGRDLTLSGFKISDIIDINASGRTSIDSQGQVVIEKPVFVGFRLIRLPTRSANACCDLNGTPMCFATPEQISSQPPVQACANCYCNLPSGTYYGQTCLR